MTEPVEPEGLTPERHIPSQPLDLGAVIRPLGPDDDLLGEMLDRGAEPYWMQDIRLAARRIQEARKRLRAAQSGDSSKPQQPSVED